MALESKERKKLKESLQKAGDSLLFGTNEYLKISRMIAAMNRNARIDGEITREQVIYSVKRDGAPKGKFFVVRNM